MRGEIVSGSLVGVVQGPALIIDVRGEERGLPLDVQLPLEWVRTHMDAAVTVVVAEGTVVEVS